MISRYKRLQRELLTVWRFGLVGILATLVHVTAVWVFIEQFVWNPYLANLLAFLMAFIVSFSGQYYWTFRSQRHWRNAMMRFFVVAVSGYALNNIVLMLLLRANIFEPSLSAVLAVLVIPPITFIASKFWAFR